MGSELVAQGKKGVWDDCSAKQIRQYPLRRGLALSRVSRLFLARKRMSAYVPDDGENELGSFDFQPAQLVH